MSVVAEAMGGTSMDTIRTGGQGFDAAVAGAFIGVDLVDDEPAVDTPEWAELYARATARL
jgi:hypothetical protein